MEQLDGKKSGKLNGELLNDVEDKEQVVYEDLNLTEEDLVIVELPKADGTFPFLQVVKVEKLQDQEESKTPTVTEKSNILREVEETKFEDILKDKMRKGVCGL